jgi:asparagine synthase (glutamine-hydrolysing)
MRDLLAHRGPDAEGLWVGTRAALGHRRLSILDIEGGAQPFVSGSGRSVVVHNGEIYNSPQLRASMAAGGRRFRTHSDTEAIVEGIEAFGPSFLNDLNGIFAFAWHNQDLQTTVLARDPFGVKPLYYHADAKRLLFASEIRALLADSRILRALDPDELRVLLTLSYNPSPGTLLSGIRKLTPGHRLRVEGRTITEEPYDLGVPHERRDLPRGAAAQAYAEALARAVAGQMLSDVPVGLFLSGGIDSAAVAALMTRKTPTFQAFTIGYRGESGGNLPFDERSMARTTAECLGLEHIAEECDASQFSDNFQHVIRSIEEPVGSASAVPYWTLARRAARTLKVVLSGQGADEPHGGYPRHQGAILATAFSPLFPPGLGLGLARLMRGRAERCRRGLAILGSRGPASLLLETYRHFPESLVDALVRPEWRGDAGLASARIERWRTRVDHLDPIAQMLYVDCRTSLSDDLLLYSDKLAMAHGLEVRVPYLDRELMRLVESIPRPIRVSYRHPKQLHRTVVARIVPAEVAARRKFGFDTPVDLWFRTRWVGELPRWLWGGNSFLPSVMRVETLQRVFEEHRDGRMDHSRRLYTLLALEFWGRSFL